MGELDWESNKEQQNKQHILNEPYESIIRNFKDEKSMLFGIVFLFSELTFTDDLMSQ